MDKTKLFQDMNEAMRLATEALNNAVNHYAGTVRDAASKGIAHRDTAEELAILENFHRDSLLARGVPGSNEQARTAYLRAYLDNHEPVRLAREAVAAAQAAKDTADAEARIWDVRQKAERAKLAALTALCGLAS